MIEMFGFDHVHCDQKVRKEEAYRSDTEAHNVDCVSAWALCIKT